MKIFLSWSKGKSNEYAELFRNWLPYVIQSAEPFISSQDISLGQRGVDEIESRLSSISFGILFVTRENYREPWLLYEAGALSRSISDADAKLIPFLIDVERSELAGSPISHFQNAQSFSKENVKKLCIAINQSTVEPLELERLERAFEKWWPDLEDDVSRLQPVEYQQGEATLNGILEAVNALAEEVVELRNSERRQTREIDRISRELAQNEGVAWINSLLRDRKEPKRQSIFWKFDSDEKTIKPLNVVSNEDDIIDLLGGDEHED